jgi:hypothetical protein
MSGRARVAATALGERLRTAVHTAMEVAINNEGAVRDVLVGWRVGVLDVEAESIGDLG